MHQATLVALLACLAMVCCVPVNKSPEIGHASALAARMGPQARGFKDELIIKAYMNGDGNDDDDDEDDNTTGETGEEVEEEEEDEDRKRMVRDVDVRAPNFKDMLEINAGFNGDEDSKKKENEDGKKKEDRRMARGTGARRNFADKLEVLAKLNGDGSDSDDSSDSSDSDASDAKPRVGNRKPAKPGKTAAAHKKAGEERIARLDNAAF